jgi:hypothetical protein
MNEPDSESADEPTEPIDPTAYNGIVISQVPGFPSWFNVKYDTDDDIYTYELGVDYESGDLTVIGTYCLHSQNKIFVLNILIFVLFMPCRQLDWVQVI